MSIEQKVGTVTCPMCGETASVRHYKSGGPKLYYSCRNCGTIRPAMGRGQRWIRENATFDEQRAGSDEDNDQRAGKAATKPGLLWDVDNDR